MNPESPVAPAEPVPATPPGSGQSPGALIRAARARAAWSMDEFAGQTKLARTTLDALERDDFAALLEPVYVRGYYRKCAKVLHIDEALLMEAYASRVQPKPLTPPAKLRLGTGSEGGVRRFSGVLVVAVLAVVLGLIVFYLRGARPVGLALPVGTVSTATVADAPSPADGGAHPGTARTGEEAGIDASGNGQVAPSPTPPPPAASATTAAAPAATGPAPSVVPAAPAVKPAANAPITTLAGGPQLVLNFVSISWARVEDANGRVMLNRVVQAGERQVLEGKAPYSVFLGNAPGVEVQYQGTPLDIKASIRDSATARFTVPLAAHP